MNKVYFGITREAGNYARIVGIVANTQLTGCRPATTEERLLILEKIKAGATDSLSDSLRDNTYPNAVVVWDKRADARAAIACLQSYNSPHFSYSVGEFGDAERTVTKSKGWRILTDWEGRGGERIVSAWNQPDAGATVSLDGNDENDDRDNCLFPTRAAARKVIKDQCLSGYITANIADA